MVALFPLLERGAVRRDGVFVSSKKKFGTMPVHGLSNSSEVVS
jgi:hypothetical protein